MIPLYPEFSGITIDHKAEIDSFEHGVDPYSDFNFTSLFSWDTDGTTQISKLNGNLVIRLPDYVSGEPVVSILGSNTIDASLHTLLNDVGHISMVPEYVVAYIRTSENFEISEDRDDFDYIYDIPTLASLSGKNLKKKRNKYNSVLQVYGDSIQVSHHKTIDDEQKLVLLDVFEHWIQRSMTPDRPSQQENIAELRAFQRLLGHAHLLDLVITIVALDGKVIGFSINEVLENGYAICHFEKAVGDHPQLATFVAISAVQELHRINCQQVNWEQDLGLEGLRSSKEAFGPTKFLKKFQIQLKSS